MEVLLCLLTIHFIADFLLQSDWMAINKSKSFSALGVHCSIYAFSFLYFGLGFVFITLLAHFIQDALTSRLTSYLWAKEQRHWFFVAIGFDQLLHAYTLAATYLLLN